MVTSPPRRSTLSVAVWPEMDPNLKQTADRRWPFAEWKAAALNRLFHEQGVNGQPGRIKAATIRQALFLEEKGNDIL